MDTGDTAWVLASAALVLLMTPGLALFYGGMVRAKSVLNMMMMSFGALALISVLWVLYGYSMAFGNDVGGGLLGSPTEFFGLQTLIGTERTWTTGSRPPTSSSPIPSLAFVAFQAVFAIITVALISGAIADRARFGPWMLFAGIWATVVYFPVAHWVFAFDGAESDRRLDRQPAARHRLRRGHGGAHQRRCRRSRPAPSCSASGSAGSGSEAAAQPAARDARCRPAVVRLVRLQRRVARCPPTARPPRSG